MTATQQLFSGNTVKPRRAHVRRLTVRRTERPSPGFVRLTLGSTGDGFEDEFEHLGFDQWFRLFLPGVDGGLCLPDGAAEGWHTRWRAMPDESRPTVRNYTIRDARRAGAEWLLDVDLVVHRHPDDGRVAGVAANWALGATVGDRVGVLDQGRIFDPPEQPGPILVVADESGLPGVEAIARSLAGREARYLLETATTADQRGLPGAGRVNWLVRRRDQNPGEAAIARLAEVRIDPASYVYAVGEATLALATRARARAAGVAADHIDFCAYWRRTHDRSGG
ncbi:MAG TPA: siderophore-interacting protein [Pseudonocardiaceae bacterium]